jgi:hypothetical protein
MWNNRLADLRLTPLPPNGVEYPLFFHLATIVKWGC